MASGAEYDKAIAQALRTLGQPIEYWPKVVTKPELKEKPLPKEATVFKVVPHNFSDSYIDGLLKATGLNRNTTFQGADRGVFGTPGVRYFGSLEDNHTLTIIPNQGWIHYTRLEAVDDKGNKKLEGPTEEQCLKWGMDFAKSVLQLKDADFARHPIENRLDYHFLRTTGGPVNSTPRVKSREVFFRRSIDGYPVATGRLYGGLWVGYGFNGMLYKFELTARRVEPDSKVKLAPIHSQLKTAIDRKQARAVRWPVDAATLQKDARTTLEIDLVELVYFEDEPDKFQKIVPPILRWEGELKTANGNHLVVFFSPVESL